MQFDTLLIRVAKIEVKKKMASDNKDMSKEDRGVLVGF